ncbi:MAG TPA: cobalt ECF transporter T component CbiQ [Chloroflexia bacterium]|nr:cobalt ECF transporter T component CbiQ [Chloroflexia bacterium]
MHVHFLDPYREGNSPIHRLDPRVKLVAALAYIVTTSLTPVGAWPVYVLLWALVLSVTIVSEIGVGRVLKRSSLALPFVLAALPLVFTSGQTVLGTVPLGFANLTVYGEGLERFLSIAVRSWISVQMAVVLATTTPFPDLLMAMRGIRIPRLLVAVFGLMWRYLFVMADEAVRLMRARESRSGSTGDPRRKAGGTLAWRAKVTGGMAGSLFLRSIERGDRIYAAMASRGYDGEVRGFHPPAVPAAQWGVLAGCLGLLALLLALSFVMVG